ncbi:DNL zinc finger domain-containing protein [Nannizzia gypsea CBS 118893]|uniref:DNL zinc finger domain-containing protein n=1 Tax=Arthroderma gypseum (strain ATCC MYA-4604 / CBS 118893) TaxID=535722 RepID=E4V6X4_ARTGP|nr:DNL zinc finger domain-containing protein [Nannizzia gypsea CBS 118893]EFQ96840.1 DNL zinc finger domain-containing protein [Nannizzia gypsea CBS 118893]
MAAGQRLLRSALTASCRLPGVSLSRQGVQSISTPFILRRTSPSSSKILPRSPVLFSSVLGRNSYSTTTRDPHPLTDNKTPATTEEDAQAAQARRDQEPAYLIYFTCKPCSHRSAHRISKHGYHKGTILITCPSCSNRHVISDHLKIFSDAPVTLEDLLAQKGMKITKGTMEGDMEWWGKDEETTGTSSDSCAASTSQPELKGGENQDGKP